MCIIFLLLNLFVIYIVAYMIMFLFFMGRQLFLYMILDNLYQLHLFGNIQ